jgi:TetR/AcrR family transcriptional regulator
VEFATHGYAGARTDAIAARAGVNRQLISYYFGGKRGLHDAITEQWRARAGQLASPEQPLEEVVRRYVMDVIEHPDVHLMAVRAGLDSAGDSPRTNDGVVEAQVADLRRRQDEGEVHADLDPAVLLVVLRGAVVAPLVFPDNVRQLTGLDPQSPDFAARYGDQLVRIVRLLASPGRRPPTA